MSQGIRSNWKILSELLVKTKAKLHVTPNDFTPIAKLEDAKTEAKSLLEKIDRESVYRVGSINMKREVTAIINRIEGIQYAVKNKKPVKELQPILASTRDKIDVIYNEVLSKVDKQIINAHIANYKKKEDNKENIEDIEAAEVFKNFSDAMQLAKKQLEEKAKSGGIGEVDKNYSRDLLHMTNIIEKNNVELEAMKVKINKSSIGNDDESFIAIRGPVITGAPLSPLKLNSAGIEFDTVYFPGVKFGFQRSESVPRMYILRNQLLIAVMMNKKKKKFKLKLKNKPLEKTIKTEDKSFTKLRQDIITLLQQRVNYKFVDVTSERGSANDYIANKQFPGIRFIWIMKESIYNHVGPIGSNETLGLPF